MSTKVPPDGGWGWMIAVAYAINNLSTITVMQGFGLVFKDSFVALGLNATDTSFIININFAFGMILGLINGPILKTFGYRKVAITGSIMYTTGVTLTTFANSFSLIIICYGMLASIGMGLTLSAFSLAFNSYFTTRRSRAMGLTMVITGLGPIFMPQVTSFLLSFYGIQGTILLFGAYSLHSMIGAMLLQPIKWHMKNTPICLETIDRNPEALSNNEEDMFNSKADDEANLQSSRLTLNNYPRQRKTTISSIDHDVEVGSIYGFDTPLPRQTSAETRTNASYDANYDTEIPTINGTSVTNLYDTQKYLKYSHAWWNSARSTNSINLGSSMKIFEEPASKKLAFIEDNSVNESYQNIAEKNSLLRKETDNRPMEEDRNTDSRESEYAVCRMLRRMATLYDLDLLRDPIYVNIMLGMSIAIFAEINFSLLTPFILADMKMTTADIASAMSVIATADLVSRGSAPFLGEWLHQTPRMMYLFSLCLLIISRTSLIFTNGFVSVLLVAIGLGMAKGIRSVYMVLVVPSYVSIQKLPSASGIQMVTNGIILTCAGPLLGLMRDVTGSYTPCIIMINCVTAVTIIMWLAEMAFIRRKSARRSKSPESPDRS